METVNDRLGLTRSFKQTQTKVRIPAMFDIIHGTPQPELPTTELKFIP
jgi:hypothetical protein